ncbi:MAG: hypothetical protein DYG92_00305 [Leptolyngbya sp. PLA1]|nr:hypothetical protein [Leptolyngbya sp. PLA1]
MRTKLVRRVLCLALSAAAAAVSGCAGGGGATKAAARGETSGTYSFWPAFPAEPRVQFLRTFRGSVDMEDAKGGMLEAIVFGAETERQALINKPYGVAMRNGRVYVCDIRGDAVVVLDVAKKQTRLIGTGGSQRLSQPVGVAVADDGELYVADNARGVVVVYDEKERYTRVVGVQGMKPASLALHGARLYVADMTAQVIRVFDRKSGADLGQIGSVGDGDGQFRLPLGVATDPQGNVYVSDMMRCRVQKFSPEGVFLAGVGAVGDQPGCFVRPKHIAVDREGVVYVVDAAFQNVQMFDSELRLLMYFGAAGPFNGALDLPAGICVAEGDLSAFEGLAHPGFEPRRLVLVTNQFGPNKVQVYAFGAVRSGYTAADLAKSAATIATGIGTTEETKEMNRTGQIAEPVPETVGDEPRSGTTVSPK